MAKFQITKRGASMSGYSLVLGLIAVVALAATTKLGGSVRSIFQRSSNQLALVGSGSVDSGTAQAGTHGAITWITTASLGSFYAGSAVNITLSATGADSYALTAGTLPPNLTFNPATHVLSGTLASSTTPSTGNFTITASNLDGSSAQAFTMSILAQDPNIANVVALYHFNGDYSDAIGGNTLTASGSAVSGTGALFGSGGFVSDAQTDYAGTSGASPAFEMGSSDFTIEGWFKATANQNATNDATALFGKWGPAQSGVFPSWGLFAFDTTFVPYVIIGNGTNVVKLTGSSGMTLNNWHHIALVRQGTALRLYVDGAQAATNTYSGSLNTSSYPFRVGQDSNNNKALIGYVDEVRITKGTARYTGTSFSVPAAAFPDQ